MGIYAVDKYKQAEDDEKLGSPCKIHFSVRSMNIVVHCCASCCYETCHVKWK